LDNKYRGNGKAVYKEALTKDVLQEIIYRAQLTTLSLNYPHTTKDRTKPYWARLVKDHVKGYKGSRNWTCRSRHFLEIVLIKGLYYRHKGKGYATEVVTTAKKLLLDGFKDIKDNSGEA